MRFSCLRWTLAAVLCGGWLLAGDEPPEINPFGKKTFDRDDAIPGYVQLSDGTTVPGKIYLTRDHRLKVFDEKLKKHREVPLRVVKAVDAVILKEWDEREWRFKENANDEKVYTGRSYPAREYAHRLTLQDGRKVEGALAAIVYVAPEGGAEPRRFLLHKRDKGEIDTKLKDLLYVRTIHLGADALAEGKRLAETPPEKAKTPKRKR